MSIDFAIADIQSASIESIFFSVTTDVQRIICSFQPLYLIMIDQSTFS